MRGAFDFIRCQAHSTAADVVADWFYCCYFCDVADFALATASIYVITRYCVNTTTRNAWSSPVCTAAAAAATARTTTVTTVTQATTPCIAWNSRLKIWVTHPVATTAPAPVLYSNYCTGASNCVVVFLYIHTSCACSLMTSQCRYELLAALIACGIMAIMLYCKR